MMLVKCTGSEAQLYVPHALTLLRGDESAQQAWLEGWVAVPLPALLPWASQMLSFLDAEEGAVLLPTLKVCPTIRDRNQGGAMLLPGCQIAPEANK